MELLFQQAVIILDFSKCMVDQLVKCLHTNLVFPGSSLSGSVKLSDHKQNSIAHLSSFSCQRPDVTVISVEKDLVINYTYVRHPKHLTLFYIVLDKSR